MYTDILLFIIAFSAFSLFAPQQPAVLSAELTLVCSMLVMACVYLYCRAVFRRCAYVKTIDGDSAVRHSRAFNAAKAGALGAYVMIILIFDFKQALPEVIQHSALALNACGVALFIALLLIVWLSAYRSYLSCCDPQIERSEYVFWHVRMCAPLVLPWLFMSAVFDVLSLFPGDVMDRFGAHPLFFLLLFAAVIFATGLIMPWFIIRLWKCTPLQAGPVRTHIEQVCSRAGVRCSGIFLWNMFGGRFLSAGVLGFAGAFRYLLISPALLELLEPAELEAVIAHETAHVRHRHLLFYLVFILGYGFITTVFYGFFFSGLHTSDLFLDLTLRPDGTFGLLYHIVILAAVTGFLILYFRVLFGFISRAFERQADYASLVLTGSSRGISGALEKIAFVAGSDGRTAPSWHHYSIAERCAFLQSCDRFPAIGAAHVRKVGAIVWGFCALLAFLAALLWTFQDDLQQIESRNTVVFAEKLLQRWPQNANLHFQLAGLYYEKKLFSAAEKEYRLALELRPDFYDAYNNLAWLYATCEEHGMRNYPESLRLARIAVSLAPHAYILDTLAECLHVNGLYRQALIAAEEALRAAEPENRSHYEDRIKKFKEAPRANTAPLRHNDRSTIAL